MATGLCLVLCSIILLCFLCVARGSIIGSSIIGSAVLYGVSVSRKEPILITPKERRANKTLAHIFHTCMQLQC